MRPRPTNSGGNRRKRFTQPDILTESPLAPTHKHRTSLKAADLPNAHRETCLVYASHIFDSGGHSLPVEGYFTVGSYLSQKFQPQLVHIKSEHTVERWLLSATEQRYLA